MRLSTSYSTNKAKKGMLRSENEFRGSRTHEPCRAYRGSCAPQGSASRSARSANADPPGRRVPSGRTHSEHALRAGAGTGPSASRAARAVPGDTTTREFLDLAGGFRFGRARAEVMML